MTFTDDSGATDKKFVEPRFALEYAVIEVLNVLDVKNISNYDYNHDYSERTGVTQLPRIIGIDVKVKY